MPRDELLAEEVIPLLNVIYLKYFWPVVCVKINFSLVYFGLSKSLEYSPFGASIALKI